MTTTQLKAARQLARRVTRKARLRREAVDVFIRRPIDAVFAAWVDEVLAQLRASEPFMAAHYKASSPWLRDLLRTARQYFEQSPTLKKALNTLPQAYRKIYEAGGGFALKKLGFPLSFNLRNQTTLTRLKERAGTFESTLVDNYERALPILEKMFVEQGAAPYDREFYSRIQNKLGYEYEYQARRFAHTESGIVLNQSQFDTFKKNGVEGKEWVTAIFGVRPSHAALSGTTRAINETWTLGGVSILYPQDLRLPPGELINCRCDVVPFFSEDYEAPEQVWSGE